MTLPELELERLKKTIERLLFIMPAFPEDMELAKECGERIANLQSLLKDLQLPLDKKLECTCAESFMSKADCRIHGISEQLNRTQME